MKIVSFVINSALLIFIISIGISFVSLMKRNKNNRKLVDCVNVFDEQEIFFKTVNEYIDQEKDEEFKTKGQVLKLWGLVIYDHKEEIVPMLDSIDLRQLYQKRGKFNKRKCNLNEDSFYYLCVASCNTLYGRNDQENLLKFNEKIKQLEKELPKLLVLQLSLNAFKLYNNEEDLGEEYFSELLQGETAGYHYARQLIGIYKDISAAYLTKIYIDQNKMEEYETIKENMQIFYKTKLGKRIFGELHVNEEYLIEVSEVEEQ